MTHGNRKIGLGVMGWAELLFARGIRYGGEESLTLAEQVMGFIQRIGHEESERLAEERGPFPNWEGSVWQQRGRKMRNATVTTIAPTGKCNYVSFWTLNAGSIVVEIGKFSQLQITYEDKINAEKAKKEKESSVQSDI